MRRRDKSFRDPLCKLNLKEMSFPTSNGKTDSSREVSPHKRREGTNSVTHRRIDVPSTPDRTVFSFTSVGNLSRKTFPSKWHDAQKWLMCNHNSAPQAHTVKLSQPSNISSQPHNYQSTLSLDLDHHDTLPSSNGKFTNSTEPISPNFICSEPTREGFLFGDPAVEAMKDACKEMVHEDVGTEMTPLGSSTTSRCHSPFKSSSPARHNTPASKSGPLSLANHNSTTCSIDLIRLEECHFAKLQLGTHYDSVTSHWTSREEEEEEISKSLRHNASQKAVSDCTASMWEEEEKTKFCLRYQREEAKIQAWVDLQSAKAEAQSRKLEVKIQKMQSKLEEKLMKRMSMVHRKAEEWRAVARERHSIGANGEDH